MHGDWLCTRIVNSKGDETSGEFGRSTDYLRFTFTHWYVEIAQAPFDKGLVMPVTFGLDSIDFQQESNWYLPELKYAIASVSPEELVLRYTNELGEFIRYFFIRPEQGIAPPSEVRDIGFIILNRSDTVVSHVYGNKYNMVDYRIPNVQANLTPCPIFKDERFSSFASYLSRYFVYPKNYLSQGADDELVFEFNVNKKGAENMKIVKGLGYEMNAYLFLFMERTGGNWHPIEAAGEVITSKLRLHFVMR